MQVISRARKVWEGGSSKTGLAERISFVAGDFFKAETLPRSESAGVAWILRQVCHDWPDSATVEILRSVRAAMEASTHPGTLCLVEVSASITTIRLTARED